MAELNYNKTTWTISVPATPDKINNIEDGIEDLYNLLGDSNAVNGQVLKKVTNGAEWQDIGVIPETGDVGNVLKKSNTGVEWDSLNASEVSTEKLDTTSTTVDAYLNELEQSTSDLNDQIAAKTEVQIVDADADLDDYTSTGVYFFRAGHTYNNIPNSSANGFLVVYHESSASDWTKQLFYRGGTPNSNDFQCFVRSTNTNGTWSNWRRFFVDDDTGWVAVNSYISYRKRAGTVWVRVRQAGGDSRAPGYVFGTLPESVRPAYLIQVANFYVGTTWVNINTSGAVEYNANSNSNYIGANFCYPVDL